MNVKHFVCNVGEDSDLMLTLYDAKQGTYISENYIVKWGSSGMPRDINMMNNHRVLFTVSYPCGCHIVSCIFIFTLL